MALMLQDLLDQPPTPVAPPPGSPPQSLLQQLMALGSVDQRHRLLQGQFDQAGQLGQGAPVDYAHGKGSPLLLAGLANLISAGVGGYQQGKAQGGLRDLVGEQTAGRTAAAQSMLGAAQPDLASLLTSSSAELPGKAQAAQDAVRGQRQSALMALVSGDPQLAGAGKAMYGDADRAQETMLGMPAQRQQLAAGALDLAQKQRGADVANSPVVAGATAAFLKRMGMPVPDGASAAELTALEPKAEKLYEAETKRQGISKFTTTPTGDVLDTRSGKVTAAGGSASTGGLTAEAIDQAARAYLKGGPLPSLGRGNLAGHTAILKRAAEISPEGDIVGNKATAKADSTSLGKAQTQADSIEGFESTALKNLDNFLATAKRISDTGVPLANKPIRAIAESLGGSPAQAQFNTARQVAIQEISKVLGGAVGGGAISDSQRHEVEGLMRGDATLEQLTAVAQTLKQDMANRKAAVAQQIATIKGRMSGKPAVTEAPAAEPPKVTHRFNPATGKIEAVP